MKTLIGDAYKNEIDLKSYLNKRLVLIKSNKQIEVNLIALINRCLLTHGNKRRNTKEIKHTLRTKVEQRDSS